MSFWDYTSIFGIIIVLIGAWILLKRFDKNAKTRVREKAYKLLDMKNPAARDLKTNIRDLQLYGGRLKRDQEFMQLRQRLSKKLEGIEAASR
jgi:hypothetical protein